MKHVCFVKEMCVLRVCVSQNVCYGCVFRTFQNKAYFRAEISECVCYGCVFSKCVLRLCVFRFSIFRCINECGNQYKYVCVCVTLVGIEIVCNGCGYRISANTLDFTCKYVILCVTGVCMKYVCNMRGYVTCGFAAGIRVAVMAL